MINPLTVQELIEHLQTFPLDAKVIALWEGTTHAIKAGEYDKERNIVTFDVEFDYWK
jgi:hypothetical protein